MEGRDWIDQVFHLGRVHPYPAARVAAFNRAGPSPVIDTVLPTLGFLVYAHAGTDVA